MADGASSREEEGTPEALRREVERQLAAKPRTQTRSVAYRAAVQMNIEPDAIPRETADPRQVISVLKSEFSTTFDSRDVLRRLPPGFAGPVDPAEALAIVIENDELARFRGGWLKLDTLDRVTPIVSLTFGQQSVAAEVAGSSTEALYLCQRLLLLLWQAAGVNVQWGDLKDKTEMISYTTATIVELPIPLLELLNPAVQQFLSEDVSAAGGFGPDMGIFRSRRETFGAEPEVVAYCHEIDVRCVVTDPTSGESDECRMLFLLHSRGDANRARVKISSELHSDQHTEMVTRLVSRLNAPDAR